LGPPRFPTPLPLPPEPDPGWKFLVNLVPADTDVVPQYGVPIAGGWGGTQGRDRADQPTNAGDDLVLSRYEAGGGLAVETRTVIGGGHGDRTDHADGHMVTRINGVWSKVTFGPEFTTEPTKAPPSCPLPRPNGSQGDAHLGGTRWVRLHGGSIKTDPAWHPGENAWLQVIDGTVEVGRIDLDAVARDVKGNPIGGRYEPEGVTVAEIDGEPWVIVGFSVGQLGHTTLNLYGRPVRLV